MAIDSGRFKSHAAVASVVLVMLAAAAGCWAFALSLRPCRVRFDPGTLVSYRLVSEFAELGADDAPGEPVTRENEISLVCIGADNEVALVGPGGGGRDEVTLLSFAADGAARVLDGDSRAGDDGKALGFFDFNLLPLPRQPTDQAWTVPLVYSALPPGKRNVEGKVRRISNTATPEFELRLFQHSLPTIEWVNERNRYQQVRDLVCTYRFDPRLGLVDHATVKCLAGVERDDGRHRWRVRVDLDLAAVQRAHDDVGSLRDLALASRDVQD
ncbi:MAG TPA: hypothetical protein VL172_18670, partial [Kofleriaceae bacterium]|nr:hypothetical protein [Kofleriaceae bacterium]